MRAQPQPLAGFGKRLSDAGSRRDQSISYGRTLSRTVRALGAESACYSESHVALAAASNGLAAHPGDADNLMGSWRYSNSVKYATPTFAGFNAEALYAFSNAAGQFALNRAFSAGVGYKNGPLQVGAAYVEIDRPGTIRTAP